MLFQLPTGRNMTVATPGIRVAAHAGEGYPPGMDCVKLEEGVILKKRCNSQHVEYRISIPPQIKEISGGGMLVDGEEMEFKTWLNQLKKEWALETQTLLALEKNSQCGHTAYSTSAGDAAHSTPNKRNTSTPVSAKKKNADPPLPASYVVQPHEGPAYDYAWYHSPLEDVYRMSDPAATVTAYADIKAVNKRVQFDLRNMKSTLLKEGLIEDYGPSSELGHLHLHPFVHSGILFEFPP
ncbi:unnamed protein product [Penicillium viridicatum]